MQDIYLYDDKLSKLSRFVVVVSLIPLLFFAINPGKTAVITILCSYPLIFFLFLTFKKRVILNFDASNYIVIFQFYNFLVLLRGLFQASSDEDWRFFLVSTVPLFLFVHFSIFLITNERSLINVFSSFLSYGIAIGFIIFFLRSEYRTYFPQSVAPIYIMIFLIPYGNFKYFLFISAVAIISFFDDLDSRSNLLNIIVAGFITFTFILRNNKFVHHVIKLLRIIILISPPIFLYLGLRGIFNIFLIGDFFVSNNNTVQDVLIDSRTGIYTDVFTHLDKNGSLLFGLGSSGKTETFLVDVLSADFTEIYKEGRRATESAMLNYIQWGGLFGGLLYFLLFVKSSYYGIYRSNNWFCVMLGIWLAYKGLFSFIEDRLSFSINSIFIFLSIGICLNRNIRQMNNYDIKDLFHLTISKAKFFRFLRS